MICSNYRLKIILQRLEQILCEGARWSIIIKWLVLFVLHDLCFVSFTCKSSLANSLTLGS